GAFRYVKLVELREINGKPFGSGAEFNVLDGSGAVINRSGWTITADSSLAQPAQPASRLIDGNPATIWHTEYVTSVAPVPHQIVVDMGTGSTVSGFRYLPRQDGKVNGTFGQYAFYVSMDGVNWGTPIAQGTFASDTTEKAVTFAPPPAPNQTPVVSNPGSPVSAVGTAVALAIAASDADGDMLSFAASGLPAGLTISASTGLVSGTPTAVGESNVTVTVTDGRGGSATASFVWTVGPAGSLNQLGLAAIAAPPRTVGVAVSYTAVPEGGVNPKVSWNFGDGTGTSAPSTTTTVSHTFSSPGLYLVEARATDDSGQSSVRQFLQAVHYPLTATPPAASTNIVYDAQRSWIWNVNPDADTVTVFDDQTQTKVAEITVGKAPKSLALGPGARMWVVNEGSASISLIDATTTPPSVVGTVPLPAASEPYGLVFDAAGINAYVALQATGRLLVLDALSGSETAQVEVGAHPRHLSVTADGTRVLVSRFITPPLPGEDTGAPQTTDASGAKLGGEVVVLDTATRQIVKTVKLQHSEAPDMTVSGRGIPNYLGAAVISPDGRSAWVPSKQDNIKRGTLRDLGANLTFENTVRAISSRVDLQTWSEDYAARLDHDNSGVASAVVFDPTGSYFFVALEASREVAVVDAYNRHELMRFDVGRAPEGLVLSSDARKLFVHNFMDRTVGVYDVSALTLAGSMRIDPLVTYAAVGTEKLPAQVLRGKQFFYDARDPQLARDGYLSCAACHNDGGHDGRTWDLTGFGEGVRDTISLKGHGGMAHGQLHWSGNFDEVQDFEGQIRDLAGGTGLMADSEFYSGSRSEPLGDAKAGHSADLDALAAYVASLSKTPGSPYRNP
ncbi:MAG: PKD domain-containing protein, partial [Gammaproteobacteria bacterium]|nr:PKD domain-containing protein [Gammaproteobacteria bacterium]